jgi:hypothetical protein
VAGPAPSWDSPDGPDRVPGPGPEADLPATAAHLARFNADQLREIERAIAEHLRVDARQIADDGFSVTPDTGDAMRIHWRGSASIDTVTFHRIVSAATAHDESASQRWRDHLPEPNGPQSRPRRFAKRRRRRDARDPDLSE